MPLDAILTMLLLQHAQRVVVDVSPRVPGCEALAARVARAPLAGDLTAALVMHGGAVRWALAGRPLVVWLQGRPRDLAPTLHTQAEWRATVADGVRGWSGALPGLRLTTGHDSAAAHVRVVWARTLPAGAPGDPSAGRLAALTAGRATLERDGSGRTVAATVMLAASAANGAPYQPQDVRAMAQHEIGHVLGLGHHASPTSVMAPLVRADRIGSADRAVLRALYSLPPGTRCRVGG
jgi:hypothetical protein